MLSRALCLLVSFLSVGAARADDRFASRIVSHRNLGDGVYGDPRAVLGKPTTLINAVFENPPGLYRASLVFGAYHTDGAGNPLVTTLGNNNDEGEIIVAFDTPIRNDPRNWFGLDFLVFGNAAFLCNGFVSQNTDMASLYLGADGDAFVEPLQVAISQDGETWYEYDLSASTGADGYYPTNAYAWDRANRTWGAERDWTKPVNPALQPGDFANRSVADAIDLYNGSAGGTAFDLSVFGLDYIRFIRVRGHGGEVDGFARVGSSRTPRLLPKSGIGVQVR